MFKGKVMYLGGYAAPLARAAAAAAIIAAFPLAASAQQFTAKIGTATVNEDQHEWIKKFKEGVEAKSNNRIKVDIFPANQLGSIPRQIEGAQLGTQEAWIGPPGFLVGLDQRFQVFDFPGVFKDPDHAFKTLTHPDIREQFLGLAETKGLKGVSAFVSSQQAYVFRRPVKTLADFRGLKLRVLAAKIERRIVEEFGASPVAMDLSEVLPAIQQGAVDGTRTVMSVFVPFKYWSVAKYLVATHEALLPAVAMFNKGWFDKLPADLQALVLAEGKRLEPDIQAFGIKIKAEMYETWVKNGGEIHRLSAEEQADYVRRVAKIGDEVAAENPQVKQFYDLMVATSKKVGS